MYGIKSSIAFSKNNSVHCNIFSPGAIHIQMTQQEYHRTINLRADDLYRFAIHCGADTETAKDAVQEAFAGLWEHLPKVTPEKSKSFLFTIVYRKVASHFRHEKVIQNANNEWDKNPSCRPDESFDLKEALQQAFSHIPEVQRAALQLKEIEGYSVKEISAILSLSEQQVMTYLFRARVSMRKYLTALGYDNNNR